MNPGAMDPILIKIHGMTAGELASTADVYREARRRAFGYWMLSLVSKWLVAAVALPLMLIVLLSPMYVFAAWVPVEAAILAALPIMFALLWLLGTHPKLNDWGNAPWINDRHWRREYHDIASTLGTIERRLRERSNEVRQT
jgi:hypothetical protein